MEKQKMNNKKEESHNEISVELSLIQQIFYLILFTIIRMA